MEKKKTSIVICLGSSCFSRGNKENLEIIKAYLKEHNLEDKVDFKGELCTENCNKGPIVKINGKIFQDVDARSIVEILNNYIL
ncbi:MAG: NAD(P)H-dependent oxidoreductase subunit E [Bacteroidetes bacterium]|nr:NAD(P)H-dependent oxidoreductase subunit E [Bacteroidota bacterium]